MNTFLANVISQFTSVLNLFIDDLYKESTDPSRSGNWLKIQKLAFEGSTKSVKDITNIVLDAQRTSVKLPIIKKAADFCAIKDDKGETLFTVEKGQTVICDIVRSHFHPLDIK
jgi:hypothetical protein